MNKIICSDCGYVFSDENNEPDYSKINDLRIEELPESFKCPACNTGKDKMKEENED